MTATPEGTPAWLRTGQAVVYITDQGFAYPATVVSIRNGEVHVQPAWGAQVQRFLLHQVDGDGAVSGRDGSALLAVETSEAQEALAEVADRSAAVAAERARRAAGPASLAEGDGER